MADEHLSWRRPHTQNTSGEAAFSTSLESSPSKMASSWRSKRPGMMQRKGHSRERTSPKKEDFHIVKEGECLKPAAPLNPLHIDNVVVRPLPHPSTYGGSDNWAMTPNGSLPSLPTTPSRVMNHMGWNHINMPSNEKHHHREGSGSKELSAARALLNRRNEDIPGTQLRTLSPRTQAIPRQSPRRPPRSVQTTSSPSVSSAGMKSPIRSTFPSNNFPIQPLSPDEGLFHTLTPPPLRHRESTNSIASSSLLSLGAHPLSHSRRASQVFENSPTSSVRSSNLNGPGYRVYRPPHLRSKDSIHALKPKVAHYDRVRTPSLRGQSRSPDPFSLSSRLNRQDGGTTPSETFTTARMMTMTAGRRRLSSLGSFHSSIYEEPNHSRDLFDSRSLYAKLVENKGRGDSETSSYRPDESIHSSSSAEEDVGTLATRVEDVELTVEDLMADSYSLTDEYCLSRAASTNGNHQHVVDIFQIGDRLGPGMMHDGLEVTIAETSEGFKDQNADLTGSQLEVVKKLGEGSYAVVYLVKEVARGAKSLVTCSPEQQGGNGVEIPKKENIIREIEDGDETVLGSYDIYGTTLRASDSGHLATSQSTSNEEGEPGLFALKCLCKRDLSDEMLKVQRLEATIHQSIPPHPCIVTLYRTYETAEWLFLILEYCPGQDLFFWLEQANDSSNLGTDTPMEEASPVYSDGDGDMTAIDSTPPSPSLLASTESRFLLSRRRLRLISRMFQQMCEAIEFCHNRGISHRDIKPENFIVEDTRKVNDRVKVKLTDFGLAVVQERCIDFDCGSKPYMSYECRNNRTRWYDPRQSDIWSLGIVLLNLIFHRNPFSEPNAKHCPSFASYVEDPVEFLVRAFQGLKRDTARFLAENVFCDVTEDEEEEEGAAAEGQLPTPRRKRITAKEFGVWASNLSDYLESPVRQHLSLHASSHTYSPAHGADETVTSPLWNSRSTTSSNSYRESPISNSSTNIHEGMGILGIQNGAEWDSFNHHHHRSSPSNSAAVDVN